MLLFGRGAKRLHINSSRDLGEPERIDEDVDNDNTNDGKSGIIFIDDNGDGNIDNSGNQDDEEDGGNNEDPSSDVNNDGYADDDNDGATDEDLKNDMNDDNKAGTKGVDDDLDGAIDEGSNQDDDEDGTSNEDWFDPVVYFLNGTTLMERMPNINPADGNGFTEYPIADNVSQFLVKRVTGGDGATVLVDITLTMSPPTADPVTLATRIAISSGL